MLKINYIFAVLNLTKQILINYLNKNNYESI